MEFTDILFGLFVAGFFLVYFALQASGYPRWFLCGLIAWMSAAFYAVWYPPALLLILFHALAVRAGGPLIFALRSRPRTASFAAGTLIVVSLAILFLFKYLNFFNSLFSGAKSPVVDLILPVGISFYTFTAIGSYVDVLRGESRPAASFSEALLLIAFWPHLAAGPILRSRNILENMESPVPLSWATVELSLLLVASGLVKKLLIADNIGSYVNWNLDFGPANMSMPQAWLVLTGFAVQIYADFSGYSDMAIGFALLLGFRLPANFNYPYAAASITDFWRRWHISLSTWFRDYVYYPLGGSRHGILRAAAAVFIVFLLSGIWHGAGTGFVIWGAAHGLFLVLEKIFYRPYMKVPGILRRFITIAIVLALWSFFRLPADQALTLISRLVQIDSAAFSAPPYISLPIALFALFALIDHVLKPYRVSESGFPEAGSTAGRIAVCLLLPVALLLPGKELPFIYFQF